MTDLLPCPFCGGDDLSVSTWDVQPDNWWSGHVACRDCDCQGASPGEWLGSDDEARASAIAAWNTRALSLQPDLVIEGGDSSVANSAGAGPDGPGAGDAQRKSEDLRAAIEKIVDFTIADARLHDNLEDLSRESVGGIMRLIGG